MGCALLGRHALYCFCSDNISLLLWNEVCKAQKGNCISKHRVTFTFQARKSKQAAKQKGGLETANT